MGRDLFDQNYRLTGHVDDQGNVFDENWCLIGHVDDQGNIFDQNWMLRGHNDGHGTLFDQNWNLRGHIDDNGNAFDQYWSYRGHAQDNGFFTSNGTHTPDIGTPDIMGFNEPDNLFNAIFGTKADETSSPSMFGGPLGEQTNMDDILAGASTTSGQAKAQSTASDSFFASHETASNSYQRNPSGSYQRSTSTNEKASSSENRATQTSANPSNGNGCGSILAIFFVFCLFAATIIGGIGCFLGKVP